MALDVRISPINSRLKWSEINSQLVSPWIPTKSFSRSLFFDLVPENPKSMDSPWNGRVALHVVLCPAGSCLFGTYAGRAFVKDWVKVFEFGDTVDEFVCCI